MKELEVKKIIGFVRFLLIGNSICNNWFLFSNKKCTIWRSSRLYRGTSTFSNLHKWPENTLDKCIVQHFADDTNLLSSNKCPSEIFCVMNNELKLLTDWLRANKISLNESKTKLLFFRPRRKLNTTVPNTKLNNFILTLEKTIIHLDIEIVEIFPGTNKYKFLLKTYLES